MAVIHNGRVVDRLSLAADDRAFAYADGVFETIILHPSQLDKPRLQLHYERLRFGLEKLGLQLPHLFAHRAEDFPMFISRCLDLLYAPTNYCRLKLTIWRMPGGLYTPASDSSQYAVTVTSYKPLPLQTAFAGISERVTINKTWYSGAKTLNSLDYVIAGQERKHHLWDEILLTNGNQVVIEAGASNLFAIRPEGSVHLAGYQQGAIHGVMMMTVMKRLESLGVSVDTSQLTIDRLHEADALFTTNVAGIRSILEIPNRKLPNPDHRLIAELRSLLAPYQDLND